MASALSLPVPSASPVDHASFQATRYFGTLDVLRAFSILAVIWHHTAASAFALPLAQQGFHGVTLFFAISGFLIVTLLLREKEKSGTIAVGQFMIKRAFRILPLYYATLLVYILLVTFIEKDAAAKAAFFDHLPAFATFTTNWFVAAGAPRVIFFFAWSLAAEEQFYLVWPWIERAKLGRYFSLTVAIVAVALSPEFLGGLWADGAPQPLLVAVVSRMPGAIGLGVILAHMLHSPGSFRWLAPIVGRRGSAVSLLAAIIAVLASNGALGAVEDSAVNLLCGLLVGAVVIRPDNDLAILMRVPGLVHIGVVSYGVYLLHLLSANAVSMAARSFGLDHGIVFFVITTIVAVAIASVSHATFERWMLRLRERWMTSPAAPAMAGPASAPFAPTVSAPR